MSSPAEVASTSPEATAPPVPNATGCLAINPPSLAVFARATRLAAVGLTAAPPNTIAPAADSASKPFRADLIGLPPQEPDEKDWTIPTCPTTWHLNIGPHHLEWQRCIFLETFGGPDGGPDRRKAAAC